MIAVFIIIGVLFVVAVSISVQQTLDNQYRKFVESNSKALDHLKTINQSFVFFPFNPLSFSSKYDNERVFESVSCKDYLIDRLNDPKIRTAIERQIQELAQNRRAAEEYRKKVSDVSSFGDFKTEPPGLLKKERLIEIEKRFFQRRIKNPPATVFFCSVSIFRSSMSGYLYDRKRESFDENAVTNILRRLKNKNGTFYNDRNIWDALCRVERGKVSNRMRFAVYERDGYRCKKCGQSDVEANLEIDHIIPISKGGKSTFDNLQTLCHECNVRKGNQV